MKIIILILMVVMSLSALTREQIQVVQEAYSMGKLIKAKNGESFENTLAAISLVESSAGKHTIGDDRNSNGTRRALVDSSLGCMQIRVATAKELASIYPIIGWVTELSDDQLGFRLLSSNQLSALIAGLHLKRYYDLSLKRGYKKHWFNSVSKYNGGWNNKKYYSRVVREIKTVKKLVKGGAIR